MNREIKFRAWDNKMECWVPAFNIPNDGITGIPKNFQITQFTGLKDKDGKEIYEGDIVDGKDGLLYAVEYFGYGFGFNDLGRTPEGQYNGIGKFSFQETTVKGNIYENPELLKDKK